MIVYLLSSNFENLGDFGSSGDLCKLQNSLFNPFTSVLITLCRSVPPAGHFEQTVDNSHKWVFCVYYPTGSWGKRSSLRSWSWSNSRGSTACVREPVLGKSAVAGGKVRCSGLPHVLQFTLLHPQGLPFWFLPHILPFYRCRQLFCPFSFLKTMHDTF